MQVETTKGTFEVRVGHEVERSEYEQLLKRHGVESCLLWVAIANDVIWGAGTTLEECIEDAFRTPLTDCTWEAFLKPMIFTRIID